MPLTGAQLRTQLADRTANPTKNVAVTASGAGGTVITLLIRAQRSLNMEDVFDALETKFGAGKVTGDRDVATQGVYQISILA